jgi:NAD(P)-dependent dehydrogenase (short-subunit alcohol dehydrogenase family)
MTALAYVKKLGVASDSSREWEKLFSDARAVSIAGAMDLGLAGKVVLVTGAGQGLGRAIGLAFAEERANVAFHYHSSEAGAASATRDAQALGVASVAVGADLRVDREVTTAVDCVERELGPIDILVNNAAATQRKLFLETTPADWATQIDVTVKGTLLVTHAVVGRMAARRSGAIVSLMGDSGRVGESRLLVTATARAATVGLTRSLAREFARVGIRANCVSIALVQTERFDVHAGGADDERMQKIVAQYPLGRIGRADDVTPMVLLLASPRAGWITGQVVSVNGGYAML